MIPQNLFGRSAQSAKYIGYFKKCSHWVSVVCESRHAAQNDMMTCESLKNLGGFQEQKWDQAISAAQP